ncbi:MULTISPECIES: N-acetylmuramoyl-L-alanine amidase [Halorussus]|uniref:N-acetylmuramoyl-L-alanine amidase n=1 Tax=Halorussus TaxID=1070314 RepID=UPI00209FD158|nr:peptidoglycan recognition family protein [Halorussus vallis]USZ78302.1 N-acetylmuramoyl-L-alanine amidase [Halorussus vallis]
MQKDEEPTSTRRDVLKRAAAAGVVSLGGTVLASSTAAAKPSVDWEAAHSSNYTSADRGAGYIDWIVIHTVQGSAQSAVNWFQDPDADVSAHYTVAQDGYKYQSVSDINIAWHAGGSNYNTYSVGIEHGGYVSGTYEDAQYRASAKLASWLCDQYGVPKQHPSSVPYDAANPANGGIIAHSQVPESTHTDPGSNWDWDYYIDLVNSY